MSSSKGACSPAFISAIDLRIAAISLRFNFDFGSCLKITSSTRSSMKSKRSFSDLNSLWMASKLEACNTRQLTHLSSEPDNISFHGKGLTRENDGNSHEISKMTPPTNHYTSGGDNPTVQTILPATPPPAPATELNECGGKIATSVVRLAHFVVPRKQYQLCSRIGPSLSVLVRLSAGVELASDSRFSRNQHLE